MKILKVVIKALSLIMVVILSSTLTSCYDPSMVSKTVKPEIIVRSLPADIATITGAQLTISGPGMDTLTLNYTTLPTSIDLTLLPGVDIFFELVVYVDNPISAATSYIASTTVDLEPGEVTVTLDMYTNEVKLLTANPYDDLGVEQARIIQIDDMAGTGWSEIISTDLVDWVSQFNPWDIDIDSNGTIIIANNDNSLGNVVLYRIADISSTTFEPLALSTGLGCIAVTVDYQNKVIYYATSTQLYRCDYLGANVKNNFDMTGITTIRGMTVDDEGILYIAHDTQIKKYDPNSGNGVTVANYSTGLLNPEDVVIKSPFLFISDVDTVVTNHKIVKLDMDLGYIDELPNSGSFPMLSPRKFIAKRNSKIYFTDDENFVNNDKLVALSDIDGSGWETYGSYGYTTGLFSFAYGC